MISSSDDSAISSSELGMCTGVCLSLLFGAYRSSAFRSIAAQVTGSGQSRRDAAGSFQGEFTNSCEARGKEV